MIIKEEDVTEDFMDWLDQCPMQWQLISYEDGVLRYDFWKTEKDKSYIYGLFDGDEQIDQTSLDEMNENLAYEIMVEDEGRNPKGLKIEFIEEVEE